MRPVINVNTRKGGEKDPIITNNNYDQNSSSILLKPLITKSKWHQIKTIL